MHRHICLAKFFRAQFQVMKAALN